MDAPRVVNRTDFVVQPVPAYGRDGEQMVAIVKSTWVLGTGRRAGELVLAPADLQRGVRFADVPWGDPASSSVRLPADNALEKEGTDVVVVADACAPDETPRSHVDVKIVAGPLERMLRAHGPRAWVGAGEGVTAAKPTVRVPLRWELALGGRDEADLADIREEPRNPVGRGVARDPATLAGKPAPQIEAIDAPVTRADEDLPPAGVGAIAPHWMPRRAHAGTHDRAWLDRRAPLPPLDRDVRWDSCAAPGLHASRAFRGGERVTLVHLSEWQRSIGFALPLVRLEIAFERGDAVVLRAVPPIDTVVLDLAEGTEEVPIVVELTWRAAIAAPRRRRDLVVRVREVVAAEASQPEAP